MSVVYQQFPQWEAPCDGYMISAQPWGCVTGEIRYFSSNGEVLTQYLLGNRLMPEVVNTTPTIDIPWTPPAVIVSPVPEPSTLGLLLIVMGLVNMMVWRWRQR